MSKRIESVKGLFGQMIHYKDGVKVGESWPGLFEGSWDHYDAGGRYTGYSDPGLVSDLVHHDAQGRRIGSTHTGFFGQKKHEINGMHGESWDSFTGESTFFEGSHKLSSPSDPFHTDDSFDASDCFDDNF